jgi:hypothetical protein
MSENITRDEAQAEVTRLLDLIKRHNAGEPESLGSMPYSEALSRLMYLRRRITQFGKK